MDINLVKAVKTRWTAKSLSSTVAGGIHHSRPAERTEMPYCIFTEISASPITETVCSRAVRFECQFDVYNDTGDPESTAGMAKTVRDAFLSSQSANTNPLTASGLSITDVRISRDITTNAEGDEQVFRSRFGVVMTVSVSFDRTPA